MSETTLLWLFGGVFAMIGTLAGVVGWVVRWMIDHHRKCHSEPMQAIAVLQADVATMKEEDERIATNVHNLRNEFSPMTAFSELAREIVLKSTEQRKGGA